MVLDLVIILFAIIAGIIGYKKGLVGITMSFFGIILSIVLGFFLQGPVSDMLYNNTGIGTVVERTVYNNITSVKNKEIQNNNNNIYNSIINSISAQDKIEKTEEQTAKVITMYIIKGLSFVVIFLIVAIICYILQIVLNLVFNLPMLDIVNNLGGIAVGVLKFLLKVYVALAIIAFLAPMQILTPILDTINSSSIGKILYDNNILVNILKNTIKL